MNEITLGAVAAALIGIVLTAVCPMIGGDPQYIWIPFVVSGIGCLLLCASQAGTDRDWFRVNTMVGSIFGGASLALSIAALSEFKQDPGGELAIAAMFLLCAVATFCKIGFDSNASANKTS